MNGLKLGGIWVLVDCNRVGKIYPKLFLSKPQAEEYASSLGGHWEIQSAFIDEK